MIAYLDLPSGISGDMFLGCLVDAGYPIDQLRFTIAALKLPTEEWSIEARQVMKGPLRATLVDVQTTEASSHRHLADITTLINNADLASPIKSRAIAVFTRLANAEAKVHGTTPDTIHFHEVGAADAIIDIVGTCAAVHELAIEKLFASPVPLAGGWTKSEHGQIPLPAPATLELLAAAKAPVRPGPGNNTPGEWVTPTGAALLAEFATFSQPAMTLETIGIGAGTKNTPWPNVARLWLGQPIAASSSAFVQLETNIDDMNPQLYSAVSDRLFAAGAKDVWFTPIQMKKNRPAILLSALAPATHESTLSQIILEETTTLGVRVHTLANRHEARREIRAVQTPFGPINIKLKFLNNQPAGAQPEYEDCKSLSESANLPVRTIYEAATAAAQKLLAELRAN